MTGGVNAGTASQPSGAMMSAGDEISEDTQDYPSRSSRGRVEPRSPNDEDPAPSMTSSQGGMSCQQGSTHTQPYDLLVFLSFIFCLFLNARVQIISSTSKS